MLLYGAIFVRRSGRNSVAMNSRPDMLTLLFVIFLAGIFITSYSQSDLQLTFLIQQLFGTAS